MRRKCRRVVAALLIGVAGAVEAQVDGELGGIAYRYLLPDGAAGSPLVVVLHGCRQGAEDVRRVTRFDVLGREAGFATLYPQTRASPLNPLGCWVWWDPANQTRGEGEPAALVAVVERVVREARLDASRVYLAGLSSGGAMAAILAALYPDVFAAVGVHSGLAFGAAGSAACAPRAMRAGAADAAARGELAYHAQGDRHRVMPVIVVHGEADELVRPVNAAHVITQFASINDLADDGDDDESIDAVADSVAKRRSPDGRAFEVAEYQDATGRAIMRAVRVEGLGHAWSGGPPGLAFSNPGGPDATRLMWSFFRRWSLGDPAPRAEPPGQCRERYAWNLSHFLWHRTMSYAEYACDPWGASWRRSYDGVIGPGPCP